MTRKRIILLYVGFLVLLVSTTYVVLLETNVARQFIENVVARFLIRDRFHIENANVDIADGTVHIGGLHVNSGSKGSVDVASVQVDVGTNPLGGLGEVELVRMRGGHLHLDLSDGNAPDLTTILQQSEIASSEAGDDKLPPIFFEDWKVTIRLDEPGRAIEFHDVQLTLLPTEPDASTVVLDGTMRLGDRFEVIVNGGGDVAAGQFRAVAEIAGFEINPKTVEAYSPDAARLLDDAHVSGHVAKTSLWFEATRERAQAGASMELSNIVCNFPELPYPLRSASGTASVSTRDEGTIKFAISNKSRDGDLTARGIITKCLTESPASDLRFGFRDQLVAELREAVRAQPDLQAVWDAFDATSGRVDADIVLENHPTEDHLVPSLDLDLRGVSCVFRGFEESDGSRIAFPYPLTEVKGRIELRDEVVHVRDVTATLADGTVTIGGSVDIATPDPRIDLAIRCESVSFAPDLREALGGLSPGIVSSYDEFAPEGKTDVRVGIDSTDPARDAKIAVRLQPLGASASYAGFPYRLNHLSGTVDIEAPIVELNLSGSHGEAHVDLFGRFRMDGAPPATNSDSIDSELWVRGKSITFDHELRSAVGVLGPALDTVWDQFRPRGKAGCELTLWRERDQTEFSYDFRLDLEKAQAELEDFRLPVHGLRGPVFVHGDGDHSRVAIDAVRGKIRNEDGSNADLVVHGDVFLDADSTRLAVTASLERLQLCQRLALALRDNGALDLETWDLLAPAGFVDLIATITGPPGPKLQRRLNILLDDVSSNAAFLPSPASKLKGEVTVIGGVFGFNEISGYVGEAEVHCSEGHAHHSDGVTEVKLAVTSPQFPVDDRLANMLSGPLRQTFKDRQPRGMLQVHELTLEFHFPDNSDSFESIISGRFSSENVRMTLGTEIEDMSGTWNIERAFINDDTGIATGGIENGAFTIWGHRVDNIRALFTADPFEFQLAGLRARLHEGRISGMNDGDADLVYDLRGDGDLSLDVEWDSVALGNLLRAGGSRGDTYSGNLAGELHLESLPGDRLIDARASGRLGITEGDLGEVPIFTAIYRQLSPRLRPRFESAELAFTIADQKIDVSELLVSSPLLTATGSGSMTLDGYLDVQIDFPDMIGRDADWVVFPALFRFVTQGIVKYQVFGYLRSPQAEPSWLWSSRPERVRLGPIPARRPPRTIKKYRP